jgi:hypothetical protein
MIHRADIAEQRQYNRFRVPKGIFVALRSHDVKVGQVLDISMGGLAFDYIPREELSSGPSELQIFLVGNVYVYKIPFKSVWDQEAKQVSASSLRMRQCGVQFGELTGNQKSELEYFIRHHTITDDKLVHSVLRSKIKQKASFCSC